MEIHFQTTNHVVTVEKVVEQYMEQNTLNATVSAISHIIILGKSAITHSKVGQSSPSPKNIEERKNSLGQVIYQKCVTVVPGSFRENCVTHAHTHMVQIIISHRRAGREIMTNKHTY